MGKHSRGTSPTRHTWGAPSAGSMESQEGLVAWDGSPTKVDTMGRRNSGVKTCTGGGVQTDHRGLGTKGQVLGHLSETAS